MNRLPVILCAFFVCVVIAVGGMLDKGSGELFLFFKPSAAGNIVKVSASGAFYDGGSAPEGLPSQTGNDGKYLKTDGSSASWDTPAGGLPATTIINSVAQALAENSENANISANQSYSATLPSGTSKCKVLVRNTVGYGAIDSYTKLMLHMDGEDDGTAFVDSSSSARTMTATGAVTKTASPKYGTASGYFGVAGARLVSDASADFILDGDFTISAWVKSANVAGTHALLNIAGSDSVQFAITAGNLSCWWGGSTIGDSSGKCTENAWTHVAFVRTGTTMKYYINGVNDGSFTASGANSTTNAILYVCYNPGASPSQDLTAYIDELKIDKGIARNPAVDYALGKAYYNTSNITLTPASGKTIKKWTTDANHSIILSELGQTVELDRDSNGDWWPRLLIGSTPTEQAD